MASEILQIVTCVANPLRWQSRIKLARAAIKSWLEEPNIHITLVECVYGSRSHDLSDLACDRVTYIPVRATTMAWSKECLLNIGIAHLPPYSHKILTLDADITFRRPGWPTEALAGLDLYPVIQPWDTAYDLGPHDEHMQTHKSFASIWHSGKPVTPPKPIIPPKHDPLHEPHKRIPPHHDPHKPPHDYGHGKDNHDHRVNFVYPHPGYAWGWQRNVLDRIGGLLEVGAMGAGDYHMALGMIGKHEASLPGGVSQGYKNAISSWATRASLEVNGKLGFVHGTLEHPFHGRKVDRGYQNRWQIFLDTGFDPATDLKRNTYSVLEFAGNKPDLERAI